jgi:hypothetical protein
VIARLYSLARFVAVDVPHANRLTIHIIAAESSTYLTLWITQAARLRPAAWSQATVECFTVQPKLVAHTVRVRTAEAKAAELSTR